MKRALSSGVLVVFVALGACDSGESTSTTTTARRATTTTTTGVTGTTIEIVVRDGEVQGGPAQRVTVPTGDHVVIRVTSDVADEVHVHGYELVQDVAAGGTVTIEFDATLPGVWEVELEGAGLPLVELEVG